MSIEVIMPRMSDTMEEGKMLKWLVKVGEYIEIGDIIAEVETDKADMEMEALDSGYLLQTQVREGEAVPVGTIIALLGEQSEEVKKDAVSVADPPLSLAAVEPITRSESGLDARIEEVGDSNEQEVRRGKGSGDKEIEGKGRLLASPLVKKIAAEKGIDLSKVEGSGPAGRIVKQDLDVSSLKEEQVHHVGESGLSSSHGSDVTEPFTRMRSTIAKRMTQSMQEAPHFYLTTEIDMSEAVRLRTSLKLSDRVLAEVTYTHLLVKAVSVALQRHPRTNAAIAKDARVLKKDINIGIAVALDDGLIVAVLRNCEGRSLLEIADESRSLVDRVRTGNPRSEDLTGGTFTISNLGMYPIEHFTAVINPPQSAILATGAIKERPVVRDGQVVISRTMMVTLSCDHRVLDGATGADFLTELKELLENPVGLMV